MPAADSGALRAEHERPARQGATGSTSRTATSRRPTSTRPTSARGGAYTIPSGNLFPLVAACRRRRRGRRSTRWASGTRSGCRSTRTTSRTSATTRPTRSTPTQFHGPPGVGRYEIVRHPANYGWPYCFKPNLPEYPWNVNLQVPMNLNNHQPVPAGDDADAVRLRQPGRFPEQRLLEPERRPERPGRASRSRRRSPIRTSGTRTTTTARPTRWGRRASRSTGRTR